MPILLNYGDLTDSADLIRLMQQIRPTKIYHLAAQSHVGVGFESPNYTAMPTRSACCDCWKRSAFSASKETRF